LGFGLTWVRIRVRVNIRFRTWREYHRLAVSPEIRFATLINTNGKLNLNPNPNPGKHSVVENPLDHGHVDLR